MEPLTAIAWERQKRASTLHHSPHAWRYGPQVVLFDPAYNPANNSGLPLPEVDLSNVMFGWPGASGVPGDVYARSKWVPPATSLVYYVTLLWITPVCMLNTTTRRAHWHILRVSWGARNHIRN